MITRALYFLKVSRPGLWFTTLWLYTLPTAQEPYYLGSPVFWLGLIYITFPLNFLVYGWNDMVDYATDQINPRKDSYLFGARGSRAELASLPVYLVAVQIPFVLVFLWLGHAPVAGLLLGMAAALTLYNLPEHGWRGRPPLELINIAGYLLILPLSVCLNHTAPISAWTAFYLMLFCLHSHLFGEMVDITPDHRVGRKTSAVLLGVKKTKLIIIGLVFVEGLMLGYHFRDWILGGFLLLTSLGLIAELLLFNYQPIRRIEFHLLGLGMNLTGFASMLWVWNVGTLTRPL